MPGAVLRRPGDRHRRPPAGSPQLRESDDLTRVETRWANITASPVWCPIVGSKSLKVISRRAWHAQVLRAVDDAGRERRSSCSHGLASTVKTASTPSRRVEVDRVAGPQGGQLEEDRWALLAVDASLDHGPTRLAACGRRGEPGRVVEVRAGMVIPTGRKAGSGHRGDQREQAPAATDGCVVATGTGSTSHVEDRGMSMLGGGPLAVEGPLSFSRAT
jgi:hypothetical protein